VSLVLGRAREILTLSLERIRELRREFDKMTSTSPDTRDALCFCLERSAWAAIEIARHWVYDKRLGMPHKDTDVFDILRVAGWIGLEEGRRLRQCAEYRLLSSRDVERVDWSAFKAGIDSDLEVLDAWLATSANWPPSAY
jgi:uncharacterized protein YutE (UPF0331/DUF86 family)